MRRLLLLWMQMGSSTMQRRLLRLPLLRLTSQLPQR
jgi:hypothetical protein